MNFDKIKDLEGTTSSFGSMSTSFFVEPTDNPDEVRLHVDWKQQQYDLFVLNRQDFPDGVHIRMGGGLPTIQPVKLPRHPAKRALYERGYRSHQYVEFETFRDFVTSLVVTDDQDEAWQRRANHLAETHPYGPERAGNYTGYWQAVGDLGWSIFASPNGNVAIAQKSTGTDRFSTKVWVASNATVEDVDNAFAEAEARSARSEAYPAPWELSRDAQQEYWKLPELAVSYISSPFSADQFLEVIAQRSASNR